MKMFYGASCTDNIIYIVNNTRKKNNTVEQVLCLDVRNNEINIRLRTLCTVENRRLKRTEYITQVNIAVDL